jgi:hypothetical protein
MSNPRFLEAPIKIIESFLDNQARAASATTSSASDLSDVVPPKDAWLARYQSGALTCQSFSLDESRASHHEVHRVTLVAIIDAGRWQPAAARHSFMAGPPGAPPSRRRRPSTKASHYPSSPRYRAGT